MEGMLKSHADFRDWHEDTSWDLAKRMRDRSDASRSAIDDTLDLLKTQTGSW
jgi:hypothetical protein